MWENSRKYQLGVDNHTNLCYYNNIKRGYEWPFGGRQDLKKFQDNAKEPLDKPERVWYNKYIIKNKRGT